MRIPDLIRGGRAPPLRLMRSVAAGIRLLRRAITFTFPESGSVPIFSAVCVIALALPLPAAQTATVSFDVPAGEAGEALKEFARQARREIIFAVRPLRGLQTNAVQGRFTVRQGLDRLIAGTGLRVVEDRRTGGFVVQRHESEGDGAAGAGARGTAPPIRSVSDAGAGTPARHAPAPVKRAGVLANLASLVAFGAAPSNGRTAAGDAASGSDSLGEMIQLSPFVISTNQDTGYQVRSTLAGTRLNTPLEDIGSAISVYNSDFLSDISATDHNEFLIYAAGMETAGAQGNLSGLTGNINNTSTSTTREDPEGGAGFGVAIRTRGLSVPTRTRGFFVTDIPSDNYNVERVTVNRGPNSILFGVGNPGGIIDSSLLRASLHRNSSKVEFRYGDNDSTRTSVDFNRVLIHGKLAARLAALYSREEYDQRPAFEEKRRLYGTVTYEPFKSTVIRAQFETGRGNANRVYTVPPMIDYVAWEAAGRQPFDWTFHDDPARNPGAAAQNVQSFVPLTQNPTAFGDRVITIFADPKGGVPAGGFSNRIRLHAPNGGNFDPVFNRDSAADNYQFIATRNIDALPAAWWPGGRIPAGIRGQTFPDYRAFEWNKRQLYESGRQPGTFNTFNIAVEQRAWRDRIGVELAYDRQRFHARQMEGGQVASGVGIDTNITLPTGEPNPNLGRPYGIAGGFMSRHAFFARESLRGTVYIKYDCNKLGWSRGKWLGRHTLTGLVEQSSLEKLRGATQFQFDGPAALQANPDVLSGNRQYRGIYYLGPSIIGNNNPVRLESVAIPLPRNGDAFPTVYYDPVAGGLTTGTTTLVEWVQSGSAYRDVIKSHGIAMQSYWLRDHLVTLAGWRRDRDYFQEELLVNKRNSTRTGPNDPGVTYFGHRDFDFPDTPPYLDGNEIFSYSAVLKWPKRLVALPGDTSLSAFYTRSDNFAPTGGRNGVFGDPLSSPTGETKEYGINISAFNDRLSIRIGRFETAIVNQTIVSGGLPVQLAETGITQTVDAWTREGNRNAGNVAFMKSAIASLMGPLPSDYLDYRRFTVSGTAPNITTSFDRPQASDTTDFSAKGTEVGIVYNPSRNWRIMANATRAETIQTNVYPITRAMLELMTPMFESTVTDPVSGTVVNFRDIPKAGYPEGFGPENPPGPNIQTFGEWLDANVVYPLAGFRATEGQASPEQRKWRVNIVANYDFGPDSPFGNRLKGWGVGAGYRWQGKIVLGYPSSIDGNGVAHFDIGNPYWGPAETNVDAWISHKRKLWNDRVRWKVQLSVKNLFGTTGLIPVRSQPWGEVAAWRIPPEKRWYITNTFEF